MQKLLIGLGIALVLIGLIWPLLQKWGFGRLPGDIVLERENFRIYFPLGTMLVVSLVITIVLWCLRK